MSSVDNRIVNMEFNNAQFEAGIAQSVDSLKKLDDSLNLKNAQVGIEQVNQAANRLNVSNIARDVDDLSSRFSNLGIIGMTALGNIANRAVNMGVSALRKTFIDPVIQGFNELELKNKSIQTIFANTQGAGTTMDEISGALDELNHYADKTIYNFAQMTDNIGKFTSAGVDLQTSVTGIKGLANLGAFSGANNNAVQRAMYQMSQALASGSVKLMDWNSLVQSGMGGMEFQEDLKRTARHFGIDVDGMIAKAGSFRESLKDGWLTNEVFLESLNHFATDASDWAGGLEEYKSALRDSGWSEDEINTIVRLGATATEAATKVRSASQLLDTVQEEIGSGWATTFDLLLGGFEGATEIFSGVYNRLSPILSGQGLFRNAALQSWINMGGRNSLLDGLSRIGDSAMSMLEGIGDQLVSVFGLKDAMAAFNSGQQDLISAIESTHAGQLLIRFSNTIFDFAKQIQLSDTALENWGKVWDGVFSIMDVGLQTIGMVANGFLQIVGALSPIGEIVLAVLGPIGDAIRGLRDWFLSLDPFMNVTKVIKGLTTPVHDFLQMIADGMGDFAHFADLGNIIRDGLGAATQFLAGGALGILNFFTGGKSFGEMMNSAFGTANEIAAQVQNSSFVQGLKNGLQEGFKSTREYISSFFKDVNSLSSFGTAFGNMTKDMFGNLRKNVPAVDWTVDHVKSAFNSMYEYVKPYFHGADSITDYLTGFKRLASDLSDVVRDKFSAMNLDSTSLWSTFKSGFQRATQYVVARVRELPARFKGMATYIGLYLDQVFRRFGANDVSGKFANFFSILTQPLRNVIDWVKTNTGEFGNSLKEFLSQLDLFKMIQTGASNFGGGLIDFLRNLSEAAKNFIPGIIDWFDDFFTRIFVKFHNEDTNMGIFDRIGVMIEKAAQGLSGKLQGAGNEIKKAFTEISDFVINGEGFEIFRDIPWADISMLAETLSLIAFLHQTNKLLTTASGTIKTVGDTFSKFGTSIGYSIKKVATSVGGFIDAYAGIGTAISNAIKTQSKWAGLTAFMKALVPVLLEVAALAGIAMIDEDALWTAVKVTGAITALMLAVMGVGNKIGSADFNPAKLGSVAGVLLGFAVSVTIIAGAVKKLAELDQDELIQGGVAVGAIGALLAVIAKTFSSKSFQFGSLKSSKFKLGKDTFVALIGMAITIRALAGTVKMIGKMDIGQLIQGLIGMGTIMLALSGLSIAMSKLGGANVKFNTNFRSMAALVIAVIALTRAMSPLANMDFGRLAQGLGGLAVIITELFAGMGAISAVGTQGFNASGLLAMAAAILVVAHSVKALGEMDLQALGQGLGAVFISLGMLVGAAALVSLFGGSLDALGNILLKFSGAALMFGAAMALIAGALGTMDTLIRALSLNNSSLGELFGQILAGLIAGFELVSAQLVDAIVKLIVDVAESLAKYTGRLIRAIANVLIAVIDGLGDVLPDIMSHMKGFVDKFSKAFVDTFGEVDWGAVGEDLALLIWSPIGAAFVAKLGKVSMKDIAKVGAAIALTVGPLIAAMIALSALSNQQGTDALNAITNAIEVIGLIATIGSLVPADIGTYAQVAVGIGAAIDIIIGIVGSLQTLFGWINNSTGGAFLENLKSGAETFRAIGDGIGSFFGSIAGGFAGGIASTFVSYLPSVGENFATFVNTLKPALSSAGELKEFFSAIGSIPLEGGIFEVFTGSRANTIFALQQLLPGLGEGLSSFADSVKGVNFNRLSPAFEAVNAVANLANSLPQSGDFNFLTLFVGRKQTLSEFAEGLSDFFDSVKGAADKLGPGEELDLSGFEKAVESAKKLVELQNSLPEGIGPSVKSFFFGDKQTLIQFAQGMCAWKTQLKSAIDEFGNGDDLDVSGFEKGIESTKKLIAMAQTLPEAGSVKSFLFGGLPKSLSDFAKEIGDLFSTLSEVDWTMPDFAGIEDNPRLDKLTTLVKNMSYAASMLPPTTPGVLSFKSIFSDLRDTMPEITETMTAIGGLELSHDQLSKVPQVSTAITTLARAQKQVILSLGDVQPGEDISDKITALSQFVGSLTGEDSTFISDIQSIATAAGEMTGKSLSNLESITGSIETLAKTQAEIGDIDVETDESGEVVGGKLTKLAKDAGGMIEGLSALANFGTVAGDDITGRSMRTNQSKLDALTQIVPQIQGLADVYATLANASVPGTYYIEPGSMLTQFSDGLKQLGPALRGIYTSVTDINGDGKGVNLDKARMDEIVAMITSIGELTTTGALSEFDSSKLSDFSTSLTDGTEGLGPALRGFYETVNDVTGEGENKIDKARITEVVDAIGEIAQLGGAEGALKDFDASKLSNFSGVINGSLGENIGSFFSGLFASDFQIDQEKLTMMMTALGDLSTTFVDLPNIDESVQGKITIFGDCLKTLVQAFGGESGAKGAVGLFGAMQGQTTGGTDLTGFMMMVSQLSTFAGGITEVATAISSIPEIDPAVVTNFTTTIQSLISAFGGGGGAGAAQGMGAMGLGLGGFGKSAGGVDFALISANIIQFSNAMTLLSTAMGAMQSLSGGEGGNAIDMLVTGLQNLATIDLATLSTNFMMLAMAMSFLAPGLYAVGDGSGMVAFANALISLQGLDFSGLVGQIQMLAIAMSSDLVNAFNQVPGQISAAAQATVAIVLAMCLLCIAAIQATVPQFQTAGQQAGQGFASGISSQVGAATAAASSLLHAAIVAVQGGFQGFYSAGASAAGGFAAGIRSVASEAASAARNMVLDAIAAAKAAQRSASPSRVYMQIGRWAVEGYAQGMLSEQDLADSAARRVIGSAIQNAYLAASQDMTTSPVIAPVVDISDVTSKAGQINSIFTDAFQFKLGGDALTLAGGIAARVAVPGYFQPANGEYGNVTNNYNMVQNNTSPKALSRMDIWRDTKNLFSQLKTEAVK